MPSTADLKKINAISGLVFGCFLAMHLVTHWSLNLGIDTAHAVQRSFRVIYQNPIIEPVVFISLLVHMISNAMIYQARAKVAAAVAVSKDKAEISSNISPELKAHRYAGYFLGLSMFGHIGATRLGPLFVFGRERAKEYDYTFVVDANNRFPYNAFLVYLVLLGVSGAWHLMYGTISAVATLRGKSVTASKAPVPIPLKMVALTSHILILSACLALGGAYYAIDTKSKADLHEKLNTAMGMA